MRGAAPRFLRVLAVVVAASCLAACGDSDDVPYYGYAEGEYVRIAVPLAARLTALYVQRGDTVTRGTPLFRLDDDFEVAARDEVAARLARAEAMLADLQKGLRPAEVDVIEAQLRQAESEQHLSKIRLDRQSQLAKEGVAPRERLDEAMSFYQRDTARVAELRAQLDVAGLAGREDQIAAARRDIEIQRAALAQAEWTLAQKSVAAPAAGLVTDTLNVEGDWVPAGSPVVVLLPDENIKLRFFVPETDLGALQVGDPVEVTCNGCSAPVPARISFISPEAEYTPPVIYSDDSRAKLVFMIEARPAPADASRLRPGQPVTVRLKTPARTP